MRDLKRMLKELKHFFLLLAAEEVFFVPELCGQSVISFLTIPHLLHRSVSVLYTFYWKEFITGAIKE